jgi:hypothetical protein
VDDGGRRGLAGAPLLLALILAVVPAILGRWGPMGPLAALLGLPSDFLSDAP